MIPVRIEGATHVYASPADFDEGAHGKCGNLHVLKQDGIFYSAWEPTPTELAALLHGGKVIVGVYGLQPPIAIGVRPPID